MAATVTALTVAVALAVRLFTVSEGSRQDPVGSQAAILAPGEEDAAPRGSISRDLSREALDPVGKPAELKDSSEAAQASSIQTVAQDWLDPDQTALKHTTTFGDGSKSVETFHPNGGAWEAYSLVRGQLQGAYSSWFDNGLQSQQLEYDGGTLHGPCKTWNPTGQPIEEGAYVHGKKCGAWHTWTSDGMPRSAVTYAAGELNGLCTYWKSDGSMDAVRSGEFVDGVKTE